MMIQKHDTDSLFKSLETFSKELIEIYIITHFYNIAEVKEYQLFAFDNLNKKKPILKIFVGANYNFIISFLPEGQGNINK